jgi:hypothetical protein
MAIDSGRQAERRRQLEGARHLGALTSRARRLQGRDRAGRHRIRDVGVEARLDDQNVSGLSQVPNRTGGLPAGRRP